MRTFLVISALIFTVLCSAQSIEEIKNSDAYIWGYGEGESIRKADKMALAQLISSISVQVESKFESTVTEVDGEVVETVKSHMNTYSSTSLQNTQQKTWEKNGLQCVFRYIEKTDLEKIFAAREVKIKDYVRTGMEAEQEARFGDAMNNYYWALMLLQSHPDNQTMDYECQPGEQRKLIASIPANIESLLAGLKMDVVEQVYKKEESTRVVTLKADYKGKPVENIEYVYDDGNAWSPLQSGRDGIVMVKLFGEAAHSLPSIRLRIECVYAHKAQIDKEVFAILENDDLTLPKVDNIEFQIPFSQKTDKVNEPVGVVMNQILAKNAGASLASTSDMVDGMSNIPRIINAIQHKSYNEVKDCFTVDGWQVFQDLVLYGNAEPIATPFDFKTVEVNHEVFVRSVPMLFSFPNNRQSFIEKVVFTLNTDGKVSNLTFALSDNAINDLVALDERFGTEEEKFHLINFMEVYKTSYCLKRIDYIENLFADNALIIVGNKVTKDLSVPADKLPQFKKEDDYQYVRKSKGEYMNSLRNVFRSSEFINLHFEDNTVKKLSKDEKVYGIQIAQHYSSASYADKGYLFLMVDLKDKAAPKIYVRSWQPEKRSDGSIIGLEDFVIN